MAAVERKGKEVTDLDDAYANMPYIPGGADYPAAWAKAAAAYRDEAMMVQVGYGPGCGGRSTCSCRWADRKG